MTDALYCILNGKGGLLPVAPLVPLILADAKTFDRDQGSCRHGFKGINDLAVYAGVDVKRLYEYASGRAKWVALDIADQYLCATGRHLRDVWPWLYDSEQISADIQATRDPSEHRRQIRHKDYLKRRARAQVTA